MRQRSKDDDPDSFLEELEGLVVPPPPPFEGKNIDCPRGGGKLPGINLGSFN